MLTLFTVVVEISLPPAGLTWAQTKHNKPNAQNCFTIVLFVNLFQNTQFTHIILLSFYFSVTVITQIFFLLKSFSSSETKSPPQALRLLQWEEGKEDF